MNLIYIFLGFFLLVIGGEFIVRTSIAISLKFNISKFIIGMTVVAFATSIPELIVSVNAAINNSPSIAINNVIGSNIANIGLVLALISILSPIVVSNSFYKKDWPIMFVFSILVYLFSKNDNIINQFEGIILLLFLILFVVYFLRKSEFANAALRRALGEEKYSEAIRIGNEEISGSIDENLYLVSNTKIFIWLIISSLSLYFGAEFLVNGAVSFAQQINISEAVISVSVIAIGTSIPELATSLIAISKKEKGISVGNLIGSNIFNIGLVLGITSIIKPITVAAEIIDRDLIWMLIFALLILILAFLPEKDKLSKYKGLIMLIGYFFFIFQAFS
tara:strand:- start:6 stop:1007 length:1002 start_codon:yes stop_codon:yes gene_type:complete